MSSKHLHETRALFRGTVRESTVIFRVYGGQLDPVYVLDLCDRSRLRGGMEGGYQGSRVVLGFAQALVSSRKRKSTERALLRGARRESGPTVNA
jgi:hypothetical protein